MRLDYLCLAVRHLKFVANCSFSHKDIVDDKWLDKGLIDFDPADRLTRSLGESVYTLNTSNLQWPDNVEFQEMLKARSTVVLNAVRRG